MYHQHRTVGHSRLIAGFLVAAVYYLSPGSALGQPSEESPRFSPLVKVVRQVESAVVSLFIPDEDTRGFGTGSGAIIHPDGYVLTNHHVVGRDKGFAVYRGKVLGFVVVGRMPEKDIAIVRLRGATTPLPVVPLGHSHDVMNGEPVVVMGNPGGRGIVVTSGIVSSKRQFLGAASALVMTQYPNSRRDGFIQFDAASNHGNSGGPLINMEGRLIGIVSALIPAEQNSGFAIPVDRVRSLLERVVEPEVAHRRTVGVRLNARTDAAIVTSVLADSPAAKAGLQSGDTITKLDGRPIRHAADWTLFLDRLLPQGVPLELVVRRGGMTLPLSIKPEPNSATTAVDVEDPVKGVVYEMCHGSFTAIPNFDEQKIERSGTVETLDLDAMRGERSSDYAMRIRGLLKVEKDGLYRVVLTSDDGSRLYLHDQMFIDHDGNHPPMPLSRLTRLKAGLHPIRIEYFQGRSGQTLALQLIHVKSIADAPEDDGYTPEFYHRK